MPGAPEPKAAALSKREELHAAIVQRITPIAFQRRLAGNAEAIDLGELTRAAGLADSILAIVKSHAPHGLDALVDPPGEETSERVAHIAAIGLHAPETLTPEQIQAVCGSALTQHPAAAKRSGA